MEVLLNQTALARWLKIAPQTVRKRIKAGQYKPVAKDDRGRPLFEKPEKKPR